MYKDPFNSIINTKVKRDIEKIDEKISEERRSSNSDRHKILRLKEQKLIQGLYSNELGSTFGKYRSPW